MENADNDIFIDILEKDSEKKSDSEIVKILLNDFLNKITEQSSIKKRSVEFPYKNKWTEIRRNIECLFLVNQLLLVQKMDIARNVVKVSEGKKVRN